MKWMFVCVFVGLLAACGGGEDATSSNSATGINHNGMVPPSYNSSPSLDMSSGAHDMSWASNAHSAMDMGGSPSELDMKSAMPIEDMSSTGMADMGISGEDMAMDEPDMKPVEMCGNGTIDDGETCDGDCPASCDDGDACTTDTVEAGDAATCDLICKNEQAIDVCGPDDGCCPAGCMVGMDPDCMLDCTDSATWPTAWVTLEDQMIAEINARRAVGGTCGMMSFVASSALVLAPKLREAARCHSLDMATRDYFGSASPEGDRVGDRVMATGYVYARVGQDVGANPDVTAMVDQWIANEANCKHLLDDDYEEVGVGYAHDPDAMYNAYWTNVVAETR